MTSQRDADGRLYEQHGPPVPDPTGVRALFGDGYDWIEHLTPGWRDVSSWGCDGWDLGDWPYVVVAHYDSDAVFGVAVRVEGDVTVHTFATREERDRKTDDIAHFYWRHKRDAPPGIAPEGEPFRPEHCGPYSSRRRRDTE